MKKLLINQACLVVGIDIAKETHWVQFVGPGAVKLGKAFPIKNSKEGFKNLVSRAKDCAQEHSFETIVFGVEPTGHYWKALAEYLTVNGWVLEQVNPMHVKRTKELVDNSPSKSDRKDAYIIGKLVRDNHFLQPRQLSGIYAELGELTKTRLMIKEKIKAVKCEIIAGIDEFFPELPSLIKGIKTESMKWLLKTAPFPEQIEAMPLEDLEAGLKAATNGRHGKKRARALKELAANSIGVRFGSKAASMRMRFLVEELEKLLEQQDEVEKAMIEALEQTGLGEYLLSMPVVTKLSAAIFLGEIGNPQNYSNWREIIKLAGLNIRKNDSGKHRGKRTITKRGRGTLRWLAYQLALVSVIHNPELKAFYRHLIQRTERPLAKKQALVAVGVRILRIMFVLVQKKQTYQAGRATYQMSLAA